MTIRELNPHPPFRGARPHSPGPLRRRFAPRLRMRGEGWALRRWHIPHPASLKLRRTSPPSPTQLRLKATPGKQGEKVSAGRGGGPPSPGLRPRPKATLSPRGEGFCAQSRLILPPPPPAVVPLPRFAGEEPGFAARDCSESCALEPLTRPFRKRKGHPLPQGERVWRRGGGCPPSLPSLARGEGSRRVSDRR